MSDTGSGAPSSTATDNANDRVHTELQKFQAALHGHEELTKGELAKIHRNLTDALDEAKAADKREKDELRAAIKKVDDWQEAEMKARADKNKVKDNTTTIVTPPADVVPATPPPGGDVPANTTPDDEGGRRKGFLKSWW